MLLQVAEEAEGSSTEEENERKRRNLARKKKLAAARAALEEREEEKRKKKQRRSKVDSSTSEEEMKAKKKKKKVEITPDSEDSETGKARRKGKSRMRKTSGSSSEGEPMVLDNWTKLGALWAVEQRPPFLRHRATVNSHTMKELMKMEKMYRNQDRKMGKADRLFTKDPVLPVELIKEGKDNRRTKFHEASFLRLPIVEPEEYYEEVPTCREPIYRHIPLKHCGAENAVNELVVVRMHDRGTPVTLKMFHGKNYAKRPGAEAVSLDGGWEAPMKMRFIQEALENHSVVSRSLWPMDYTPNVIQRVLIRNNWGGVGETDAVKASLITDFFDDLMTENAALATQGKEPADFRRGKELWAEVCERHGVGQGTSNVQGKGAAGGGGSSGNGRKLNNQQKQWDGKGPGNGSGAGRQWDKGPRQGTSGRTAAKVGSVFVCHRYNEPQGCGRPKQGQGCRGWNGQIFAHNCNVMKANGEYCLEVHPKKDHV
jgi:hypothetical protein